jgi:hypothetical protein
MAGLAYRSAAQPSSLRLQALRLGTLLLPILLLVTAALRGGKEDRPQLILWIGAGFQVFISAMVLRNRRLGRHPLGATVLVVYMLALAWLTLGQGLAGLEGWYSRFAQGLLFLIAMMFFARLVAVDSGMRERHEAYSLALRIAERSDWPADLGECRNLPELTALRLSLHGDPVPALALLGYPHPAVRLAGLFALQGKRDWFPGQLERVVGVLNSSTEPEVRATALRVLAPYPERWLIEKLGDCLSDSAPEVRRAALDLLRYDAERRWHWLRPAVRAALANAEFQESAPQLPDGVTLPVEAVKDLRAWIAEKGLLTVRATLLLIAHYERLLIEQPDEKLIDDLRRQLLDPHTPAILRIELAQLLHERKLLDRSMYEKLLDPMNSAPLRVLSADALLAYGSHAGAVTALRDVARMPNRDIALATADVVQRRLGVDLSLPLGQALPSITSRQAADITRRVMTWAREVSEAEPIADTQMLLQ